MQPISQTQPFYVPTDQVFPGQSRYSWINVQDKMSELKETQHDNKKSFFPLKDSFPVVKAPFGYVLTDGHHHVIASNMKKGQTIPIKVIANHEKLSEESFWEVAKTKGWAYLNNRYGVYKQPPRKFSQLNDDPNRYFASLIAAKVSGKGKIGGANHPVWVKVGKGVPFVEFMISDKMWQNGLVYNPKMTKPERKVLVEATRKLLCKDPIPGVIVVPERKDKANIDFQKLIHAKG